MTMTFRRRPSQGLAEQRVDARRAHHRIVDRRALELPRQVHAQAEVARLVPYAADTPAAERRRVDEVGGLARGIVAKAHVPDVDEAAQHDLARAPAEPALGWQQAQLGGGDDALVARPFAGGEGAHA